MFYSTVLRTLPDVSMMGQVTQKADYTSHQRNVPENIMIFLRNGDMRFTLKSAVCCLAENDWLLLPRGSDYHLTTRGGCTYSYIHFQLAVPFSVRDQLPREDAFMRAASLPYSLPVGESTYRIVLPVSGHLIGEKEKIWTLLTECDMQRLMQFSPSKLRIDLCFAEILSILDARSTISRKSEYPVILSRVLRYIHEHCREDITLSSLSETHHLSRQYLMRLFQKHLNMTVTQYISRLRMSHALELLRQGGFLIGDVANMLGYQNPYYFCRVFRRQFGMTPSEYARHMMASDAAERQAEKQTPAQ